MENHSCKTYFSVNFDFDRDKNAAFLKERRDCTSEDLGISNKTEVEKFIFDSFGIKPEWRRHHFVIGYNENYNTDVNEMIRLTLKNLICKADKIKQLQKKFTVTTVLKIVPYIVRDSEETKQILSLDKDIIEFLHNSDTILDLDYYVI